MEDEQVKPMIAFIAGIVIGAVMVFFSAGSNQEQKLYQEELESENYALEEQVVELQEQIYYMEDEYIEKQYILKRCYYLADGYYSNRLCDWLSEEL